MNDEPTVLGLDLGTTTGWALLTASGERVGSGILDCSFGRWEGAAMRGLRFQAQVQHLLEEHKPSAAVYELVRRHKGAEAAHVYGDLQGVLLRLAAVQGVPLATMDVGGVKRHATGRGNAPKKAMVAAAKARWGRVCQTDDEADALWLASAWLLREGRELLEPGGAAA